MNSPTFQPVLWTQTDAEQLFEFLRTPLGARFIEAIRPEPTTKPAEPVNPTFQLGVIHGYRLALAHIDNLSRFRAESPEEAEAKNGSSAYPPLPTEEDDAT